ncbi:MAG: hypothetical protein Q4F35_08380, partial [Akkermansia sp.]|nr:hypothetical protein [Akkermansia sp.]
KPVFAMPRTIMFYCRSNKEKLKNVKGENTGNLNYSNLAFYRCPVKQKNTNFPKFKNLLFHIKKGGFK